MYNNFLKIDEISLKKLYNKNARSIYSNEKKQ
jgi:hypothetical protein